MKHVEDDFHRRKANQGMGFAWEVTPQEGQRVEVAYRNSTNLNVWYKNGVFVNRYGSELYNVIGWRSTDA